jgi:hypothetical protein
MSEWFAIRFQLDSAPSPELIEKAAQLFLQQGYPFPKAALRRPGNWVSHRYTRGDGFLERALTEAGLVGRYWLLNKDPPDCDDGDMIDENVIEFGLGVDPDARRNRALEAPMRAHIRDLAQQYVEVTLALGVEPTPVRFEALAPMRLFLPKGRDVEFAAAVAEIAPPSPPTPS